MSDENDAEPLLITGARLTEAGRTVEGAWIRFAGEQVEDRGVGPAPEHDGPVLDAGGRILAPGFIDLHMHGGGGAEVSGGPDDLARVVQAHRAHGTTRTVLSMVSMPLEALLPLIAELADAVRRDPLLVGIHLEGPFISPAAKGAHDPSALAAPSTAEIRALLDSAGGTLTQVTIAPELPGASEAIRALVEAGVHVAVGHTTADLETAGAAFEAGADLLTHTFNAMPPLLHRAPGPIGAALQRPQVTLELIADGLHVHPVLIAALFQLAPARVALVTDAMAAAGHGDGAYRLGAFEVEVRDGAARIEGGSLAGSTLTLDAAVRTAVRAGVPLEEAIRAVTETPARLLGRSDLGSLVVGSAADAVLLDEDLTVHAVWGAGRRLV